MYTDIWFNGECPRRNLRPRYISLRCNSKSTSSRKAIQLATRVWIKDEVKRLYFRLSNTDLKLKCLYFKLTSILHPAEFDSLHHSLLQFVCDVRDNKFEVLQRKLWRLSPLPVPTLSYINQPTSNITPNATFTPPSTPNLASRNLPHSSTDEATFDNNIFIGNFGVKPPQSSAFSFHPRTLNLSNCLLSQNDLSILNLGLKYNFTFQPKFFLPIWKT